MWGSNRGRRRELSPIESLRRGRVFFKLTAITVVVAFLGLTLQPLAIAANLPKAKAATPKAPSREERLTRTIEDIEDRLGRLENKLTRKQDVTKEKNDLKVLRQELEVLDTHALKDFDAIEQHLKAKQLPQGILDRHTEAVKTYKREMRALKANLQEVETAKNDKERKLQTKKATEHLKTKQRKRSHQRFKPEHLPYRTPDGRMRREHVGHSKETNPFEKQPIRVAATGLTPGLLAGLVLSATPMADDLSPTLEVPLTQEIQDLAMDLGGTPVKLYEFVRNAFAYEPYAGSVKGASLTLKERGGNDWDLASLLIALFRASDIPARYVVGTVEIPIDRAMSWLGVEDPTMASTLLASIGRNTTTIIEGGKIAALRTERVWVRAYVPYAHSRGARAGSGDTWIDLDPSFKLQNITKTLARNDYPVFDQAAYLSTLRTEGPLDFYKTQLQGFLDANAPGYVPEALARNREIVAEVFGVLPASLPFKTSSIAASYTEVPNNTRQYVAVEIRDRLGTPQLSYTAPLPAILEQRLTLSYVPASQGDSDTIAAYGGNLYNTPPYLVSLKPQIKMEGAVVAEGLAVGAGQEQTLVFQFVTPNGTDFVENTIVAGEYHAIALNAQAGSGSHQELLDRTKQLQGIPDPIDLTDPTTLDDRLGELLYLHGRLYHHNLNMAERKIAAFTRVVDVREVSAIMHFLTTQTQFFFGVPRTWTPAGITADLDRNTHLVIPVDGDLSRIRAFLQLEGNQTAFLEHDTTERIYQTEALSAVKSIQLAHNLGIPVHTVTPQNISTLLPTLQVDTGVKTDITNAVHQGWQAVVPQQNLTVQDWSGVGYILQNPENGEGFYRISGGYGGAVVVRRALMEDMFRAIGVAVYGNNASKLGPERASLCYPGWDNVLDTKDDPCFDVISIAEIHPDELDICEIEGDPGCQNRYRSLASRSWVTQPLIDSQEAQPNKSKHLTKHILIERWKSTPEGQQGQRARYIRVGFAILTAIETAMKVHGMRDVTIFSAYRSYTRAQEIASTVNKASTTTHHMDGVAADFNLFDPDPNAGFPIPDAWKNPKTFKPQLLCTVDMFAGSSGEVLHEGKSTAVHAAIPGFYNRDFEGKDKSGASYSWSCRDGIPN